MPLLLSFHAMSAPRWRHDSAEKYSHNDSKANLFNWKSMSLKVGTFINYIMIQ